MDHKEIIETFARDYAAAEDQRVLANEDIRFVTTPGGQWEGFLESAYSDRAKMQYDMISTGIDHFMSEWEAGEVLPKFRDEDATDDVDESDLVDGLFRACWRKEGGKETAKNAVYEAVTGGFGAIRLGTRYLDEYNAEDGRQEVTFTPIFSAPTNVVYDANAKRIDKRDADHVSVIHEYTPEAFKKKWPDADLNSATMPDDKREFNWATKNAVFVIEFYKKVERSVVVHIFMNDLNDKYEVEAKELDDAREELEIQGYAEITHRRVRRTHIEKSILSGAIELEKPRRVAGKILPIIPVYAHWAFVDGQERYWGKVRKQKDPQRIINMNVSNLAELASTSPKDAPIFDPEQVKGLQTRWAEAHLGKKNFHLARALRDKQGNVVQAGPVGWLKPPQIDPATQGLLNFSTEHIRSTSTGMPQDIEDTEASGKAILAVQKRVDMFSYTIMGNISSAMKRLGECFISIAQEVYTDNRKALTISADGTEGDTKLNQRVVEDGQIKTLNTLSRKRFEVYADVGPSYESQRRETIEFMKELLTILPENDPRVSAIISGIIDNMDGVGLQVIKDLNRKQMLLTGMVEPQDEEEAQMLQQAQQQNQQPESMEQLIQSEVAKNMSEVEEQQANKADKEASARKKEAETAQIIHSIGLDKAKLMLEGMNYPAQ